MQDPGHLIPVARAWAVLILGCAGIIFGLVENDAELLMLGFAVLGAEPMARSVNGRVNGL